MSGFLREHSLPIVFSVLLHALLAAILLYGALLSVQHAPVSVQPLPIDAVVVDSQVLRAAQQAVTERAEQDAARVRAAAEQKAAAAAQQQAAAAAAVQAQADAKQAEEQTRAANEAARVAAAEKVQAADKAAEKAAEARAAELKHADEAKRAADAKAAEDAKRAADAKQAEDAKRAADLKAKSERESELRRQMAAEERANAVQSSPLRDQYIARLQSRIQNAWIRPPSARVGLDCLLEVTQSPSGEVLTAHVTQCNGDAVTSDSIQNAALRASPLPTPPDPALFERTFVFHFHPDQ